MIKKPALTLILALLAIAPVLISAEADSKHSNTLKPATYRNPLLPEREMADPDVIRVNGDYYLYATTDSKGYEVFVSKDLVHWELRGRAFDDPRQGAWAPDVFYNSRGDGKCYLYYTDNSTNGQHGPFHKEVGVAVAESPLGPFSDKAVLCQSAIDAHLFQDDDGSLFLYYVDLDGGFKIMSQPMPNPVMKKGKPTVVIEPTEPWEMSNGHVTEGPFMLKRKGVYYLMYSGTGADSPNYGIGYVTAKSPLGPFVKYAGNPIVHRGDKVIGPGHHCVIEGPDHKLWLVYHQKWEPNQSYHRFLAIDPLWFDEQGHIHARASRYKY
jgi:xylan 1,4-beta-xylosidase